MEVGYHWVRDDLKKAALNGPPYYYYPTTLLPTTLWRATTDKQCRLLLLPLLRLEFPITITGIFYLLLVTIFFLPPFRALKPDTIP
jgi:hypothetical protein